VSASPGAGRPLLVMVSGKPWDGVRGADRHLTDQLVRRFRVLWVDPPVSPATPAEHRPGVGRLLRPMLAAAGPGVVRLTPVVLPGLTRPGIRATTWPLVRAQLRWALRRLGERPHAVVVCSFDDVLGRWGEGVVDVLYGTDDWVAGAELMGLDRGRLEAEERRALDRADVVVAVTPALAERWAGLGADPVLIPNGCDPSSYADVETAAVPEAAAALPGPVVGLVGRVTARIDIGLLEAIVDDGMSLLVVGPLEDPSWEPVRWPALVARPDVLHVGGVPFAELPGYLRAVDVGVTPYRDTEFNRASFPLKTLEYLAAGRAAVGTDLPATRWLAEHTDGLVTIASPGDFPAAVRKAADEPRTAELAAARRTAAAAHSWADRADRLATALGLHYTERTAL
jgi:teichuronic acid biosynthesis glycosyltransferase TuaH